MCNQYPLSPERVIYGRGVGHSELAGEGVLGSCIYSYYAKLFCILYDFVPSYSH